MTAYTSAARIDDLFGEARRIAPIGDLVEREGLRLMRSGASVRSACPLCGAGASSRSAFEIKGEKWRCYGACDTHGDVVDLEQALRGGTAVEAAQRLIGGQVPTTSPRARPAPKTAPSGPSFADQLAVDLWMTGRPILGTVVERYLRWRGISPEVIALAAPNLRFHPFAKHSWDQAAGDWIKAPAMLARPVTVLGPTGGVHATYLARDGKGKAPLTPAKKMWGPQLDRQGRPGGAWLIGPEDPYPARDRQASPSRPDAVWSDLATGEGIETVLSVVTLSRFADLPFRACAALSLSRLQGGVLKDEDGCMDVFKVQPDPQRPPFTWPAPERDPWGEVLIAVDRDMSEVKVKARSGRGRIVDFRLTPEARAKLCGRLAVKAWLAAGAPKARAIAPPVGSDFNDMLRRMLARRRST